MATYTTVADVRDETQIEHEDIGFQDETQYENLLDELILYAERIIDNYCKVPSGFFIAAGLTITDEYHDHGGSGVIYLFYYPTVLTTLSVNTALITEAAVWVALTASPAADSDFISYPEYRHEGKVYIYDSVPSSGYRNIKVTYQAGYAAIPADVSQVCNEIVANIVRGILKRKLTPQDLTRIVTDGGDIQAVFAEGVKLNESQKSLLDSYKIRDHKERRG